MKYFNSLGSNYSSSSIWGAFFGRSDQESEQRLKALLAKRYGGQVTLVYKGREALQLAIKSLNLPSGSAVAITGFTCFAVYKAVKVAGASVHYLDISGGDLNFSAPALAAALKTNPSIKAVVVQNSLGYTCDIVAIEKTCRQHNLTLIEDLAHSVGAVYADGREVGTVGDMVMLSFGRDKMIDAVAGGALIVRKPSSSIVTSTPPAYVLPRLRDRIYPLLTAILRSSYNLGVGKVIHASFKIVGLLSRSVDGEFYSGHSLPAWNAALALSQFDQLDANLEHRRRIAAEYHKSLNAGVLLPSATNQLSRAANLRFPILVPDRQKLITALESTGLYAADIWYDAPVAPKRLLSSTNFQHQCPASEEVTQKILNLPTHRLITPAVAKNISESINTWLKLA